jgi:hypothetical protein
MCRNNFLTHGPLSDCRQELMIRIEMSAAISDLERLAMGQWGCGWLWQRQETNL